MKLSETKVLVFADEPHLIDLRGETTLTGKIHVINQSSCCSTNFMGAMDRICAVVLENNLGANAIPGLLVISDMQFDQISDY